MKEPQPITPHESLGVQILGALTSELQLSEDRQEARNEKQFDKVFGQLHSINNKMVDGFMSLTKEINAVDIKVAVVEQKVIKLENKEGLVESITKNLSTWKFLMAAAAVVFGTMYASGINLIQKIHEKLF